jgi:hypothetical protein
VIIITKGDGSTELVIKMGPGDWPDVIVIAPNWVTHSLFSECSKDSH